MKPITNPTRLLTTQLVPLPGKYRFPDLTGQIFSRLTVVGYAGKQGGHPCWHCQCECGMSKPVRAIRLIKGTAKSCGCLHAQAIGLRAFKHGQGSSNQRTPEYRAWCFMHTRCFNTHRADYARYGGRGITVCERWRKSFENFFADMGEKPTLKHTLDRIDVNGNYEPLNCRWASRKEQTRNTRRTRLVTFQGHVMSLIEATEMVGLNYKTVRGRLDRGWDIERALITSVKS